SNFLYTYIYENLLDEIDQDIKHIIYSPQKKNNNKVVDSKYKVLEPEIISNLDSFFTFYRRNKSYRYLRKEINLQNDLLIHSHTLTNDGILAYYLFKKYKINYILTIRNTNIKFTMNNKKNLFYTFKRIKLNNKYI